MLITQKKEIFSLPFKYLPILQMGNNKFQKHCNILFGLQSQSDTGAFLKHDFFACENK